MYSAFAVALAIAARLAVDPVLGVNHPYATLFVAVLVSAGLFGAGPGVFAVLLGELAANYFLLPPRFSFALQSRDDVVGLLVDTLVGVSIALLAGRLRDARSRQESARMALVTLAHEKEQMALREREHVAIERQLQLQLVVAQAPIAIAMLDRGMRYVVASQAWRSYFGQHDRDLVGACHFDLFPNISQQWHDTFARCLAGAVERGEEERVERPDGSVVWYRWEIQPWSRSPEAVDGIIIYTEDITARKIASDALRASEERTRLLIEAATDYAIYMLDVQGKIVTWNSGAERLMGYTAAEAIGDHFARFHTPEEVQAGLAQRALSTAEETGRFADEGWRVRRDGSRFWAEGMLTRIVDGNQLVGFAKVLRDMTERRRADELRRAVVDNAFDTIISIDQHGTVESFNGAGARLFGYAASEIVGKNVKMLMPEPYREEHDAYIQRYLQTGEARIIGTGRKVTGRRKDGLTFPVELAVTEFSFDSERHFAGTLRDLTERNRLEDQLRQATKMEAVGRLAGGVAHDFNNILFVILGYGQMLLDRVAEGERGYSELAEIVAAAERATDLTRQLLMFSRQHQVEAHVVDVQEVVSGLQRMLSRIVGEDIQLRHDGVPVRGRVCIPTTHLEQIVMNLVVNARDAMPQGGTVELRVDDAYLDGEYAREHLGVKEGWHVALRITDSGVGMEEHVKARIFEPFFTTKETSKGTGLGLSMVLSIVQQCGGAISVISCPGKGTTFTIHFPISDEVSIRQAPKSAPSSSVGGETILLVEDEPQVREIAARILEEQGYRVHQAINGADALHRFGDSNVHIDLLLTDVIMPQVNGFELAVRLQQQRAELRILFMSGYTDDAIARHEAFQIRGHNFITKPAAPAALLKRVREVLDAPSALDEKSRAG